MPVHRDGPPESKMYISVLIRRTALTNVYLLLSIMRSLEEGLSRRQSHAGRLLTGPSELWVKKGKAKYQLRGSSNSQRRPWDWDVKDI